MLARVLAVDVMFLSFQAQPVLAVSRHMPPHKLRTFQLFPPRFGGVHSPAASDGGQSFRVGPLRFVECLVPTGDYGLIELHRALTAKEHPCSLSEILR